MNPADIFVIVLVVLSALVGLMRGFIREVLSVVSWVGAAFVTLWSFDWSRAIARDLLKTMIDNPTVHDVAGATVVFVVSLIIFSVISHFIASLVTGGVLGAIDRSLGFLFGVARGALLVGLAYIAVDWWVPAAQQPPWIKEARSLPLVQQTADFLWRLAPETWRRNRPQQQPQPTEDEGTRRARQAQDAERALRALSTPASVGRTARDGENGYNSGERRQVDRLISGGGPATQGQPQR
jgi:membrane protein required for colicin V production